MRAGNSHRSERLVQWAFHLRSVFAPTLAFLISSLDILCFSTITKSLPLPSSPQHTSLQLVHDRFHHVAAPKLSTRPTVKCLSVRTLAIFEGFWAFQAGHVHPSEFASACVFTATRFAHRPRQPRQCLYDAPGKSDTAGVFSHQNICAANRCVNSIRPSHRYIRATIRETYNARLFRRTACAAPRSTHTTSIRCLTVHSPPHRATTRACTSQ